MNVFRVNWGFLQNLVFGLTGLRELRVWGYIIDPSFLLLPPPNVKSLEYSCDEMTPTWWRNFSRYPFIGVGYLALHCRHQIPDERPPTLGGIEITSLRQFNVNTVYEYPAAYPPDLLDLIIENNPNLSPTCLQTMADEKAKGT